MDLKSFAQIITSKCNPGVLPKDMASNMLDFQH